MHFITGGAHNGKTKWVEKHYASVGTNDIWWMEPGKTAKWPDMKKITSNLIVLKELEQWMWIWMKELPNIESVRAYGYEKFLELNAWERHLNFRQVVVIGTDISKGIVPMETVLRDWRDVTGWVYQDIIQLASKVDLIWYGLATNLKREGE